MGLVLLVASSPLPLGAVTTQTSKFCYSVATSRPSTHEELPRHIVLNFALFLFSLLCSTAFPRHSFFLCFLLLSPPSPSTPPFSLIRILIPLQVYVRVSLVLPPHPFIPSFSYHPSIFLDYVLDIGFYTVI